MSFDYEQYLRLDKFPLFFCAGCGDGIVLKATLRDRPHRAGQEQGDDGLGHRLLLTHVGLR